MKNLFAIISFFVIGSLTPKVFAQTSQKKVLKDTVSVNKLYIDVHELNSRVKFEDVAEAHKKDLATQKKYGVNFIKYWVDEEKGLVYCLSSSKDTSSIIKTHEEAHGLLPSRIYPVDEGEAASIKDPKDLFLDIHYLGEGNVTAKAVETAHKKDLAIQRKYNVNFINYWVNEKEGVVMCLSEAKDSVSVINTHKEAHGMLPNRVIKVKQGE